MCSYASMAFRELNKRDGTLAKTTGFTDIMTLLDTKQKLALSLGLYYFRRLCPKYITIPENIHSSCAAGTKKKKDHNNHDCASGQYRIAETFPSLTPPCMSGFIRSFSMQAEKLNRNDTSDWDMKLEHNIPEIILNKRGGAALGVCCGSPVPVIRRVLGFKGID